MRKRWKWIGILIMGSLLILSGCQKSDVVKLDPEHPVSIKVWCYYAGATQKAFEELIDQYNQGEGREKGIIVESENHGIVSELAAEVMAAAQEKVGSSELPSLFMGYADTVYELDQQGLIADLDDYFTQEELDSYVPAFIEEGRVGENGELLIFPIAKSTELFMMNKTDWDVFASETGTSLEELETIEGVTRTAKTYYEWSGGKAFFGRDALANYLLIGAKQLGCELFLVENGKVEFQLEKEVLKKLWDHYYIPSIYGYFDSKGRYRSDDTKVGDLLAYVGSSSSASFFPDTVYLTDETSYDIEAYVTPAPIFQDGEPYAVQQGAGMAVIKSTREEEYAAVEFMKWFTSKEQNVKFSVHSGYLPVKQEVLNEEALEDAITEEGDSFSPVMRQSLKAALDTCTGKKLKVTKAFPNASAARSTLSSSMISIIEENVAEIEKQMEQGISRHEAASSYDTAEYFESWMNRLQEQLEETQ